MLELNNLLSHVIKYRVAVAHYKRRKRDEKYQSERTWSPKPQMCWEINILPLFN